MKGVKRQAEKSLAEDIKDGTTETHCTTSSTWMQRCEAILKLIIHGILVP